MLTQKTGTAQTIEQAHGWADGFKAMEGYQYSSFRYRGGQWEVTGYFFK